MDKQLPEMELRREEGIAEEKTMQEKTKKEGAA